MQQCNRKAMDVRVKSMDNLIKQMDWLVFCNSTHFDRYVQQGMTSFLSKIKRKTYPLHQLLQFKSKEQIKFQHKFILCGSFTYM